MCKYCPFTVDMLCRVPIVLVGNKKDLHMQRVVTFEMGKKLASEWNVSFIESSAKQNEVSGERGIGKGERRKERGEGQ